MSNCTHKRIQKFQDSWKCLDCDEPFGPMAAAEARGIARAWEAVAGIEGSLSSGQYNKALRRAVSEIDALTEARETEGGE